MSNEEDIFPDGGERGLDGAEVRGQRFLREGQQLPEFLHLFRTHRNGVAEHGPNHGFRAGWGRQGAGVPRNTKR